MIDPTHLIGEDDQIERVREADPLSADMICARLPRINANRDVGALLCALRLLVRNAHGIAGYTMAECLAAMRDLGFVLGSIRRYGVEPTHEVPQVVPVLVELGARTGMVPRDTVLHHSIWNPIGARRRTYTGDVQEQRLQDADRLAFPRFRALVELCDLLLQHEPVDSKFPVLLQALHHQFAALTAEVPSPAKINPIFLRHCLQPFRREIQIAGRAYAGPSQAQLPIWLADEILWATDRGEPYYEDFRRETAGYTLPHWRGRHDGWSRTPSVTTRLLQLFAEQPAETDWLGSALRASANELVALLSTMIEYREKQLRLFGWPAPARMPQRPADRSERPAGRPTVGERPDDIVLHRIVALTRRSIELVRQFLYGLRPDPALGVSGLADAFAGPWPSHRAAGWEYLDVDVHPTGAGSTSVSRPTTAPCAVVAARRTARGPALD